MMKRLIYIALTLFSGSLLGQISPVPASYACDGVILSESFEAGIPAGWTNVALDAVKNGASFNSGWVIDRDTTFTAATGPDAAQDGTFYVYCDGNGPTTTAQDIIMTSPILNIGDVTTPALTFYLNMHGQSGSFTVNVIEGGIRTGVLPDISGNQTGGIHTSDQWEQIFVDLSAYINKTIQIEFVATKPPASVAFKGDIAIDNVVVCSAPTTIPTMGEWSLIILSLLMMIVGLQWMKQKDTAFIGYKA